MKIRNAISIGLAVVAVVAAGLGIYMGLAYREAEPVLVAPSEEAESRILEFMDAVCEADFEHVTQCLSGSPDLGLSREPADEVGKLIWNAYTESMSYDIIGQCHATDDGLAQRVSITALDMANITAALQERAQELLEQRVKDAHDTSEIYDENNEYRDEFVAKVLCDAAEIALQSDATEKTMEFTVNLTYQNEQWMILADNDLLNAISGGILY